jgi:hypothetical protein
MSTSASTSRQPRLRPTPTGRKRTGRATMGDGMKAILEPFEKISSVDYDFARYCRLDEELAARELEQALWELPEVRRGFAYRMLLAISRAILNGAAWQFSED